MNDQGIAGVLVLIAALATAYGPKSSWPGVRRYVDDTTITTKVKGAISLNSQLNALDIRVETNGGIVQLSGSVDTKEQSAEAFRTASEIAGVKSVHNNLIVRPHGAPRSSSGLHEFSGSDLYELG